MPAKKEEHPKVDKKRQAALEGLYEFWDKARSHIAWSLAATVVCPSCTVRDGQFFPGKAQTEDGKCAFCGNTGLIPDKTQRNWATDRLTERLAPAPKAVEMTVDDNRKDVKDLEEKTKDLSDKELNEKLQLIDFSGKENVSII